MDPYKKIEVFKNEVVQCFKNRVQCILLTGSYSRGEETDKSDIDMWIFLDKVQYSDLNSIAQILLKLPREPKLNPQCTSFNESLVPFFIREYSPIQYNTDGKILYGSLKIPYPKKQEFLYNSKTLSVYVLMGIRHFICTNESEEVLLKKKLAKRILKPLMWALRYKCAGIEGIYPLKLEELRKYSTEDEIKVIDIYEDFLKQEKEKYNGKVEEILNSVYIICEKLLWKDK